MVGRATGFACHGQLRLVEQPELSGHTLANLLVFTTL